MGTKKNCMAQVINWTQCPRGKASRRIILPILLCLSLLTFGQKNMLKKLYLTQSKPYYGACGFMLSADILVFTEDTLCKDSSKFYYVGVMCTGDYGKNFFITNKLYELSLNMEFKRVKNHILSIYYNLLFIHKRSYFAVDIKKGW